MGLEKKETGVSVLCFSFVILMGFSGISMAGTLYQVGDSAGWTIIGNVDYNSWASSKTFQAGDSILFEYNPQFHNVLQVTRSDFHTCEARRPIRTFNTGNDTIALHGHGHYYYICGFMGHCEAGQKVDIRVPKPSHPANNATSIIPSPSQDPSQVNPDASPVNHPLTPSPVNDNSGSGVKVWCDLRLMMIVLCSGLSMLV